mmetsp:Transcript_34741/g.108218  ORF Transcript_34741/g.108218 Transcript_34741/m.108218 type:complete len:93 (+) Transcript_34741:1365-1643(+)
MRIGRVEPPADFRSREAPKAVELPNVTVVGRPSELFAWVVDIVEDLEFLPNIAAASSSLLCVSSGWGELTLCLIEPTCRGLLADHGGTETVM